MTINRGFAPYADDAYRSVPEWELQDRLVRAFRRMDYSVQELASALGVSRNTVGAWLNGHTKPSRAAMMFMAKEADVPLYWLETGMQEAPTPGDGGEGQVYGIRDSNPEPADSGDSVLTCGDAA